MLGLKIEELNLKYIRSSMRHYIIAILPFALSSCVSTMLTQQKEDVPMSTLESLHELRSEVAQLTHLLHGQSVDIQILEEKLSNLSLKRKELLSENLEAVQAKVDHLESVLANVRLSYEHSKKQHQSLVDTQLARLVSLENKVSQHDSSLHIIKDIKSMMTQIKPQSATKSDNLQNYRVESGDTLEGISRKFGVRSHEIKKINNLDSDYIQVGQTLKIPL
jgi:LysM repeat protein